MIAQHKIGLLFSETGSYARIGRSMRAGAQLALEEVNRDRSLSIRLEAVSIDPMGDVNRYYEASKEMLGREGISQVIGCYTSSSRKEILPVFERHDALLWYPSHYEGFESSEHVIYTGASPNQHIVPLLNYLIKNYGRRAWCVGSNYIWPWENNRILREQLQDIGGQVLGERYFMIGDTELRDIAQQIVADRPDFVFSTLIGDSFYRFVEIFRIVAEEAGVNQALEIPVASCTLSESELPALGAAKAGHLSSSVYFSSIDSPANKLFSSKWLERFGHLGLASADAEASYLAVHFLARALLRSISSHACDVRLAARGLTFDAPQGPVAIDSENLHCHMKPRIGLSKDDGSFQIVFESDANVRPDPYLVWTERAAISDTSKRLRVVK